MKNKLVSIFVIVISLLCIHSVAYAVEDDGSSNLTWTDFSKAKYEIQTNEPSSATLSISNVAQNTDHLYYYSITSDTTKPSIDDLKNGNNRLGYSSENKVFTADISSYVELNQDLYLWIVEHHYDNNGVKNKYVVEGKKLERPKYPIYSDVFFSTMITHRDTQILFNVPWSSETVRKINIKIGEISDSSILNKLKNNENDAFENLLLYSKTATTLYNNSLISNSIPRHCARI